MTYNLEQFSAECHQALKDDPGEAGRAQVRACVEKALQDPEFVETHLGPDNDSGRKILYEDPEFGFCILAHVYKGERKSSPHDHGPSWAIYGQAKGVTEMTEWRLVEAPQAGKAGRVQATKRYDLNPGQAALYEIGHLHSPKRESETRLIRIEGKNMENVDRDKFEAA